LTNICQEFWEKMTFLAIILLPEQQQTTKNSKNCKYLIFIDKYLPRILGKNDIFGNYFVTRTTTNNKKL
jgi:hypothetical protein